MNPLLKMAVLSGATRSVELHLGKIADIDIKDDKGMSLLMYAAMRGHAETCRILLDAGADPYIENREGKTALCLTKTFEKSDATAVIQAFIKRDSSLKLEIVAEPSNSSYESLNRNFEVDESALVDDLGWIEIGRAHV